MCRGHENSPTIAAARTVGATQRGLGSDAKAIPRVVFARDVLGRDSRVDDSDANGSAMDSQIAQYDSTGIPNKNDGGIPAPEEYRWTLDAIQEDLRSTEEHPSGRSGKCEDELGSWACGTTWSSRFDRESQNTRVAILGAAKPFTSTVTVCLVDPATELAVFVSHVPVHALAFLTHVSPGPGRFLIGRIGNVTADRRHVISRQGGKGFQRVSKRRQ
jgi:hypothetical protein